MAFDLWSAYDQMGPVFAEHAADSAYNAHYDRPAVLDALGPVAELRVLDAACGPGLYAQELARQGATVTAFDASMVMVELARARLGDRAQVDRAVLGEPLPYPTRRSTSSSAPWRSTTRTTARPRSASSSVSCALVAQR